MSFYYARRNHGKLLMWGSQVDQWCRRIAREKHMVQISSTECAPIPLAVRGVMHGTVPRLNKYLDRYADALDRHGEWNDIPNRKQTVVSLQALPIGPYSERLPTHVAENADPTASARFRNPDDAVDCAGLAFQTDATCSETSILREPLFARPAVTCPADNPFANVQSYATTFFGAAAAIAYEARCALLLRTARTGEQPTPRAAQQLAKAILNRLHDPSMPPPESPFDYRIGIAICNLLHFVYPWKRGVAEPIVRWSYAHAAAAVRKTPELNLVALERKRAAKNPKADPNDLEVALAWWSCFARERHSAWDALAPLLERILEANGSFDNTLADIDAMAADLETAVRGVWCVESPDGVQAPPPGTMLEGALTHTFSPGTSTPSLSAPPIRRRACAPSSAPRPSERCQWPFNRRSRCSRPPTCSTAPSCRSTSTKARSLTAPPPRPMCSQSTARSAAPRQSRAWASKATRPPLARAPTDSKAAPSNARPGGSTSTWSSTS
jgi:hypothetical protein